MTSISSTSRSRVRGIDVPPSAKGLRPAIVTGLMALVGIGCSRGDRAASGDQRRLTIARAGSEWQFGPAQDDTPKFLLFLPLAMWDNPCRTGDPTGLADRWEHTPDRREWTFHLRRDIRWHDGAPVTAHDVAFNIDLWHHHDVQWYGAWNVDSAMVVDDYAVTLFLKSPGRTSDWSWDVYYPKHLLEGLDPAGFFEWEFWTRPVGNGPYRYVRHDPETHVDLEANADYYLGEPTIKRVRFTFGGPEFQTLNLLSGVADIVGNVAPWDAEPFLEDDRFVVHYGNANQSVAIRLVWNLRHPLFTEKSVRQALTLAIDRRGLARALGYQEPALLTDGTYSWCLADRDMAPPPWPLDPDSARSILARAGWRDEDGDGTLERDGVPFRFEALVAAQDQRAAVFAQEQLRQIGVTMDVAVMAAGPVNQRFRAGEFDAAIPALAGVNLDRQLAAADSPNGYANSRARELWARYVATDSIEEANDLLVELSEIYHDELPGTILYSRIWATVARPWLTGLADTWEWLQFLSQVSIAE